MFEALCNMIVNDSLFRGRVWVSLGQGLISSEKEQNRETLLSECPRSPPLELSRPTMNNSVFLCCGEKTFDKGMYR